MDDIEIEHLIIMEYYGIISEEDKSRLDEELATNEKARAFQEALKASAPETEARAISAEMAARRQDGNKIVENIYRIKHERKKRKRNRFLITAALVCTIITGFYILRPAKQKDIAVNKQKDIFLQFADGKIFLLKDTGYQIISWKGNRLVRNNDLLTFENWDPTGMGLNVLSTAIGKKMRVALPDGTEVQLENAANISFPSSFNSKNREIYLEGQAFFTIAGNAQLPCAVHVRNTTINVLGTEFNVKADSSGRVYTSLVSGSVSVTAAGEKILLPTGKQAIVLPGQKIKIADFDSTEVLGWRRGEYFFAAASTDDIKTLIENHFGKTLKTDSEDVKKRGIRFRYTQGEPLDSLIRELNAGGKLHFYFGQDTNVLRCRLATTEEQAD